MVVLGGGAVSYKRETPVRVDDMISAFRGVLPYVIQGYLAHKKHLAARTLQ